MFTDWTQTDPHYFYVRGIILGVVIGIFVCRGLGLIINKRNHKQIGAA